MFDNCQINGLKLDNEVICPKSNTSTTVNISSNWQKATIEFYYTQTMSESTKNLGFFATFYEATANLYSIHAENTSIVLTIDEL